MANAFTVIGRIFGEPQFAYNQQGLARVNVKVTDGKKNKDGTWTNVQFDCTIWGASAEAFAKYFHDKNVVVISGKIKEARIWTDKEGNLYTDKNGQPKASITVDNASWDFAPKDGASEFQGPPTVDGGVITGTEDTEYGS